MKHRAILSRIIRPKSQCVAMSVSVLILLIRIVAAVAADDVWSTDGPKGGIIYDIAISPVNHETIFIGTIENHIYKTTDSGQNWQHLPRGILGLATRVVIPHPQNVKVIYVSTAQGVFKTENSGGEWTQFQFPWGSGNEYRSFAMNPENPDMLFAIGTFGEFWKTTDGGQSWYAMQIDPVVSTNDVAIDPSDPSVMYFAGGGMMAGYGVGKSVDMGESWFFIHNNLDSLGYGNDIEIDPADTRIIYFARVHPRGQGGERCLSRSTDGGAYWEDITPPGLGEPWINKIRVMPWSHNVLFCCTKADGVLKSTDSGSSWAPCNSGLKVSGIATLVADTITGDLYLGTYYDGIYKSTDEGANWINISYDINLSTCTDMAFSSSPSPKVFVTTHAGLFISGADTSWSRIEIGLPFTNKLNALECDLLLQDVIYLASDHSFSNDSAAGFYLSQDGGASWQFRNQALPAQADYADLAVSYLSNEARRILLASSAGMYYSDDMGIVWQVSSDGLPPGNEFYVVESCSGESNVIAAGDTDGRVFISFDAGAHWTQTSELPISEGPLILDLEFDPLDCNSVYVSNQFEGIYRSTDSGLNWININGNLPWVHSYFDFIVISGICINPYDPQNIFVEDATFGVYQTHDCGQNWEPFNSGLDTTIWGVALEFFPGDTTRLFLAAYDRSVWSIHRTIPDAIDDDAPVPRTITLSSYPNPFNSNTTISYSGIIGGEISMYDINGQLVRVIRVEQGQDGKVNWDGRNRAGEQLGSGVYFARAKSRVGLKTIKMVYMK